MTTDVLTPDEEALLAAADDDPAELGDGPVLVTDEDSGAAGLFRRDDDRSRKLALLKPPASFRKWYCWPRKDLSLVPDEAVVMGWNRWSASWTKYVGWGNLRKRQRPFAKDSNVPVWNDGKRVDHPHLTYDDPVCDCRGERLPPLTTRGTPLARFASCEHRKPAGPKPRPHVWWESDRFTTPDEDDPRAPSVEECREYTAALVLARILDYETWTAYMAGEWRSAPNPAALDYLPVKALVEMCDLGLVPTELTDVAERIDPDDARWNDRGLVIVPGDNGEERFRDDRATAKLAEALSWVPKVRYEVAEGGGDVPRTWGVLFPHRPAADITLRWQQLAAQSNGRTNGDERATQDEAWRRLDDELRAALILYYQADPKRLAKFRPLYPDGTPIGGPALTVTALNKALTWRRNPPATMTETPWSTDEDGNFRTYRDDGTWQVEDNAPIAESLFEREQELYEANDLMDEQLDVSASDRQTLFEWMREHAVAGALGRPVDWQRLARRYHIKSEIAAMTKVRRARDRFHARASELLPPDHSALFEYEEARGLLDVPAIPKRTVKAILQSYGVDLSGLPNPAGWVSVRCPWDDRGRPGGAGWHPAQDLYRCFTPGCVLPTGEVLTAERLADITALLAVA